MRTSVALVVLAPLCLVASRTCSAEDLEELIKRGVDLRRRGDDQAALADFRRAAAIQRTHRVVAQIGLAEDALGLWVDAERDLTEALSTRDDPWIELHRETLESALAAVAGQLGSLSVTGHPEGALVFLNGVPVGRLPLSGWLRVPIGSARLRVEADGLPSLTRQIEIQIGSHLREEVDLKAPATPPEDLLARNPASGGVESRPPVYSRWWLWTGVGAVVAGVVVGAVILSTGHGSSRCDANAVCSIWGGGP